MLAEGLGICERFCRFRSTVGGVVALVTGSAADENVLEFLLYVLNVVNVAN